jgi:hypothetical protein
MNSERSWGFVNGVGIVFLRCSGELCISTLFMVRELGVR